MSTEKESARNSVREAVVLFREYLDGECRWTKEEMIRLVADKIGDEDLAERVFWTEIYLRYAAPDGRPI